MLFLLAFAAQSVTVIPPPSLGWAWAEQVANGLRRACLSEAGVNIAMNDWAEGQEAAKAHQAEEIEIERELGEAAYTAPIDIERLSRAIQARNEDQAQRLAEGAWRAVATLRRLSQSTEIEKSNG